MLEVALAQSLDQLGRMSFFLQILRWCRPESKKDEEEPLLPNKRDVFEEYQSLPHLQSTPNVSQQREWLHIDEAANVSFVTVDKHAIVTELGVHYRDLRFVDPLVRNGLSALMLPAYSCILLSSPVEGQL